MRQQRPQRRIGREAVNHESAISASVGGLQQSVGERGADALTLPRVSNHETQLPSAIIGRAHVAEPADVATRITRLRDQNNSPRIVHIGQQAQQRLRQDGHWQKESKVTGRQTQAREQSRTAPSSPLRNGRIRRWQPFASDLVYLNSC